MDRRTEVIGSHEGNRVKVAGGMRTLAIGGSIAELMSMING
jgi:hypothetical protein